MFFYIIWSLKIKGKRINISTHAVLFDEMKQNPSNYNVLFQFPSFIPIKINIDFHYNFSFKTIRKGKKKKNEKQQIITHTHTHWLWAILKCLSYLPFDLILLRFVRFKLLLYDNCFEFNPVILLVEK